ncbi:MAG: tyrosine-type recombinase/integrase [Thermodesulfobacteriota bacterium]
MLLSHLYLAARRGELFRLEWSDVDFAGERVRLGTRKRKDGSMKYEWIPMAGELYDSLLAHRKESSTEQVFVQESGRFAGKPFLENRGFPQGLCAVVGVKPFGRHAIRHLTASILASRDIPMVTIQTILRHKKLSTTERYIRGMAPVRPHLDILLGHT